MKILSEKELIKLQAKGVQAIDARGKAVAPRLHKVEEPKQGEVKQDGVKPEEPDAMTGILRGINSCLQALVAVSQKETPKSALPAQPQQIVAPVPAPVSWRFDVKRNAEGFIQEITAKPE